MKKTLLFLGIMCMAFIGMAQNGINYQAVVRDAGGNILANTNVSVVFTIKSGTASGTTVYSETQSISTNDFGNMVAIIGEGTATTGTFSYIDWGSAAHFLNIKINGTDMGTTQFMSVPYAQTANSVDKNKVEVNAANSGQINLGGNSNAEKLTVQSSNVDFTAELVDLRVDTLNWDLDVLNLYVGTNSDADGQFLEARYGSTAVFQLDVDGEVSRSKTGEDKDLLPIAYGSIDQFGNLTVGSSNIGTITHSTSGEYYITVNNETINGTCILLASLNGYPNKIITAFSSSGKVAINIRASDTFALTDGGFSFIVYKP